MTRKFAVLVALVLAATTRGATAEEALGKMADDIKKYAASKNTGEVRIEGFRGVGQFSTSGGPFLVQTLTRLLKPELEVKLKARLVLVGEYEEVEDKDSAVQGVRIRVTIRDREEDKDIPIERRFVTNQTEIARLLGLSVEFPPGATKKDRNDVLKTQIDRPKPVIRGTVLPAATDSKFAVEVLVKEGDEYKPRAPADKDNAGLAFVEIKRVEVYAVRLINDQPFDAAVALTIDGLSLFTVCDKADPKTGKPLRDPAGKPLFHHVIVPAGQSVTVKGWFVNLDQSDEFKVTAYPESLANLFPSDGGVGTITAEFHAAVDPKAALPPGEPQTGQEYSQSADATGRGKRFDEHYGVSEQKIGALRAAVSVRYAR